MDTSWMMMIEKAQKATYYDIDGVSYLRVPFQGEGEECPYCSVAQGQLHVPGCDVEVCPVCSGQSNGCGCGVEEE